MVEDVCGGGWAEDVMVGVGRGVVFPCNPIRRCMVTMAVIDFCPHSWADYACAAAMIVDAHPHGWTYVFELGALPRRSS